MPLRPDGTYDYGDGDMANPEYWRRNAAANNAIRGGQANPFPGFQSVGVSAPLKSPPLPSFAPPSSAASSTPSAGGGWGVSTSGSYRSSRSAQQPRLSLVKLLAVFLMLLVLKTIIEAGSAWYHSFMTLTGL